MVKIDAYISVRKENRIENLKGDLFKIASKKRESESDFGEIYITTIYPGKVKGWKYHKKMTSKLFVIRGSVRFTFCLRDDMKERYYFELSEDEFESIEIKPGVWMAFECISSTEAYILNFADIPHDDSESINKTYG